MKTNYTLLFFCLFLMQFVAGQTSEKQLIGKIVVDSVAIENVNVFNSRNQKSTATTKNGEFKIPVKIGDLLIFTAVNLEIKRKFIRADDLREDLLILKMVSKVTELDVVDVNANSEINAENLRIISADQKKYTPAERKLATAQSGLIDPLLNKISGRTAMLKKEVLVEHNEKLLVKLDGLYEDKYYIEELMIPEEHIKGFQYYIIADPDFSAALEAKNKTLTMFFVKRLAVNYNEILLNEKQN